MSYGEQFEAAMACETKEEAQAFLESQGHYILSIWDDERPGEPKPSLLAAMNIVRNNLGYMAGYYGEAEAKKMHELFGAVHPIFGTSTYHTDVTPEEAFKMGQEYAKNHTSSNEPASSEK